MQNIFFNIFNTADFFTVLLYRKVPKFRSYQIFAIKFTCHTSLNFLFKLKIPMNLFFFSIVLYLHSRFSIFLLQSNGQLANERFIIVLYRLIAVQEGNRTGDTRPLQRKSSVAICRVGVGYRQ